ncbi:hypothetical protein A4X13_0g9011 [Tilletia indica]|uniref:Uncharacterized protein n=1 Tax=Tilletia indica TaxID=43049 RepID=A0A8T8SBV0_9BASI|nr:hypothetical protein A4X13_0g9011 [Tilletia indica]
MKAARGTSNSKFNLTLEGVRIQAKDSVYSPHTLLGPRLHPFYIHSRRRGRGHSLHYEHRAAELATMPAKLTLKKASQDRSATTLWTHPTLSVVIPVRQGFSHSSTEEDEGETTGGLAGVQQTFRNAVSQGRRQGRRLGASSTTSGTEKGRRSRSQSVSLGHYSVASPSPKRLRSQHFQRRRCETDLLIKTVFDQSTPANNGWSLISLGPPSSWSGSGGSSRRGIKYDDRVQTHPEHVVRQQGDGGTTRSQHMLSEAALSMELNQDGHITSSFVLNCSRG